MRLRHLLPLLLLATAVAPSHADTLIPYKGLNACVPADTVLVDGQLRTGDAPTPLVLGNGHAANRATKLPAISTVVVTTGVAVFIHSGRPQVEVEADDNILALLTTDLQDGVLTISATKAYAVKDRVNVEIHLSHLKRVEVSGGGDVEIDDAVLNEDLAIVVNGAAEIKASGTVKTLSVTVAGTAELHLGDLTATSAELNVVGSTETELTVTDALKVTLSGTGSISYHGEPKTRTTSVTGTGRVERKK